MLDLLRDIIYRVRAKGTTTALVAAAYANPTATLFVPNYRMKRWLEKQYPSLQDRIVVFDASSLCSRDFNGPLLFEKEVVLAIAEAAYEQGKNDRNSDKEHLRSIVKSLSNAIDRL